MTWLKSHFEFSWGSVCIYLIQICQYNPSVVMISLNYEGTIHFIYNITKCAQKVLIATQNSNANKHLIIHKNDSKKWDECILYTFLYRWCDQNSSEENLQNQSLWLDQNNLNQNPSLWSTYKAFPKIVV